MEDEELITIPNKNMIGEVIVNSFDYRIVESCVAISYNNDAKMTIPYPQRDVHIYERRESNQIIF